MNQIGVSFNQMLDNFNFRLKAEIDNQVFVKYSAYKLNDDEVPINNLDEIAIAGKVRFYQKHDSFFGEGYNYVNSEIENPTWIDVAVLANNMIHTTGDKHHKFLEGVKQDKDYAYFVMGS